MKILLYSWAFWPSIGGVETITDTLAENIVRLGHECVVVTETPSDDERPRNYKIVRRPTVKKRFELARECSLVHSNGASVAMFLFAKLNHKPFVWTHNGYQVAGLWWTDGDIVFSSPKSTGHLYFMKKDLLSFLKESVKLAVRRYVGNHVDLNIAATSWIAKRQPLKKQVVAYTPYPLDLFKTAQAVNSHPKYDFIYVGRLVSEKGVSDLIRAFHLLVSNPVFQDKTLAIVGNGSLRNILEQLVADLGLARKVFFLGVKCGDELIKIISEAGIGVVPSVYEEPMGGITLELLAAGKNVIVSKNGGHAECLGDAGLTFQNGDYESLHKCMVEMLTNQHLAKQQLEIAKNRVNEFNEKKLTEKYIEIYKMVSDKQGKNNVLLEK